MAFPKRFQPGQTVKFTYRDIGEDAASRFKEVLILHPGWQGRVHAIDLKRLTPAEREVLFEIMAPDAKSKPHKIPLVNDILRRMNPVEDIKNPVSFYAKFVKVFLRDKDAYRQYYPRKMYGVIVVKQTAVKGGVVNPKPLFHGTESKAPPKPTAPTKPTPKGNSQPAKKATAAKAAAPAKSAQPAAPAKKPMNRLDMIKAMAAKKKKEGQ